MIILIFLIICIIFYVLQKIFIGETINQQPEWNKDEVVELTFKLPREIITNDRPDAMPVAERERRRRRLLQEVFQTGYFTRELLEAKHREDKVLEATPYSYLVNNISYVKDPNQSTKTISSNRAD